MRPLEIISPSEQRTEEIAADLAAALKGGDVVALYGDLGAGKTCFVRGLASGLGIDPMAVSSPTFIILQEYGAARVGAPSIAHLDGYRLQGLDELETIGWNELLERENCIIAVEWAERFEPLLPAERIDVHLAHLEVGARRITLTAAPALEDRVGALRMIEQGGSACPVCDRPVTKESPAYPFCSKRCRLADLGNWFGGRYRISRAARNDDWLDLGNTGDGH